MAIDVVVADTAQIREAVYALRYAVYVDEMQRPQPSANHETRTVRDGLDESAVVLAAIDRASRQVVGTVRTNFLRHGHLPVYSELYRLATLTAAERDGMSVTTRLMVARPWRRTATALRLAHRLWAVGVAHGITYDYIDCNRERRSWFERLGYARLGAVSHPDYGEVELMRLRLSDAGHRSALARGEAVARGVGQGRRDLVLSQPERSEYR